MTNENTAASKSDDTVWVPVSGGREAEMTIGEAARIANSVNLIRSLDQAREFSRSRSVLSSLREWAINQKGLDINAADLTHIRNWWFRVDK